MTKMLGADVGSFKDKLDRMVERKYLTPQQRDNLVPDSKLMKTWLVGG
jgi:hypothetical protein